jgi:hypothetical protein
MKLLPLLMLTLFGYSSFLQAQVDYQEEIQPIFDQNCTSCHGGTSGVTLSNYSAVMNSVGSQYGTNIVVPESPDSSPLVDKIEPNPDFGTRMPQGGALSDEEIQLIRTWIAEGASEIPVSAEQYSNIPKGFEMIGNYPNPFNPTTTVTFITPQQSNFSLKVYNSTGVLVKEISGISSTPRTKVDVVADNMPSGIYFYRVKIELSTNSFYLKTQKMALTK